MRKFTSTFLVLLAAFFCATAHAAGGTLIGKTLTPFPIGYDTGTKGMTAPDGGYIEAGVVNLGSKQMALVKLRPDGRLDTSFGPNHDGKSIVTLNGNTDVWGMAWDPNAKYLVAGATKSFVQDDPAHMSVARFNLDGTLDTTFGGGKGYEELYIGTADSGAYAVAVQYFDHKVVLGGYSLAPDGRKVFSILRLNPDGSLDTSFANNGVYTGPESYSDEVVRALLWVNGGGAGDKIVATGTASNYVPIVRLNSDGTPDTTFASTGKFNPLTMAGAQDMTMDSSGNLLIVGTRIDGGGMANIAVIRVSPQGNLDNSFGTNSSATFLAGDGARGYGIFWDPDGHIVATGSAEKPAGVGNGDYGEVVRFNSNGTLDTTFGTSGRAQFDVANSNEGYGVFMNGSGGYVITGADSNEAWDHLVMVLKHDGTRDTTFNATGLRDFDLGSSIAYATSSAKQSDGSVVVAGWRDLPGGTNNTIRSGALVRYRTDGSLDPSFGVNGLVFVDPVLNSVAIAPDGKIVAAGYLLQDQGGTNIPMMSFVRLNANGSRDTSFGSSGVLTIPATSSQEIINAVTVLADGRIVGAGDTIQGTNTSSLFVRLLPSGSLDTSFGGSGKVVVDFVPGDTDFIYAMSVQADGKIVGAGFGWGGAYDDMLVVRLNPDGTVDTGFGRNGNGATFIDFNHQSQAFALALMGDGHIVAGGSVSNTSDDDLALARLNSDGTLDNSFGNGNGLAQFNIEGNDRIHALAFSPSGRLTAVGDSNNLFLVAQFLANGSLDPAFGTGGIVRQRMNAGLDIATALQFQADGTIFVTGPATYVFALGRFTGDSGTTALTPTTTSLAADRNPVGSSTTVNYTAVVSSSAATPDGSVTFLDNGSAMCTAVPLVNGSATCSKTMVAVGNHTITANYLGTTTYAASSATMTETVNSNFCKANLASASNGGVATASSQYGPGYPVSAVNDGECAGKNWTNGGGWADGTIDQYPDWVQVQFNGPYQVSQVVVYTLQDNWQNPVEPTGGETFTQYGIVDYDIQYWDGTTWQTAAIVNGNNLVMRSILFDRPFNTDRIRVSVRRADGQLSRITELEAFGLPGTPLPPPASTNAALASAGATATASSTFGTGFEPAGAIDGDRTGANWTHGGGWADGTVDQYPDWLQVNFGSTKTIDHVVVTTLQDNWQSPSQPTDTMTFTQYGIVDFSVQGWNGTSWVELGSVTGNNLVMRTVSFAPFSTDRIRVVVTRALGSVSRIVELEAWTTASAPAPQQANVALASMGTVASASSSFSSDYPVTAINDNERAGRGWSMGGGWADGTIDQYPDWVQLDFSGPQTLDHVVVYTLQDNWQAPSEPTDSMTFTQYGITDFTVQGWDGTQWVTLGSVSGNNLVKRTVSFASFTTSKIRINVTNAMGHLSRITEVEAWGFPATTQGTINYASAAKGGTASGSSRICNDCYLPSNAIDGDRTGAGWANYTGGWADGTPDVYPDTLTVTFNGTKTIDHVTVYTLQDNYQNPVEPTDTMTFTQYGIQDFTVEGWNGSQWVTLGTVVNNNFVKRNVAFAPFTTNQVRVVVTRSLADYTRIIELEAWGN